jgi:hypothetical protein
MGFLDDVLGKSVPQGNYTKPLLIALGALLASGMLHKKAATTPPPGQPTTPPSVPTGAAEGGLLGGLGGLLERPSSVTATFCSGLGLLAGMARQPR